MGSWSARISILRIMPTAAVLLLLSAVSAFAQSNDVRSPTVVDGNEIVGAIPARDIGDARLTDHFYTFNGLPGDLFITIESKNLNGDFDVFTAAELRPVLKIVAYAESSTAITKNIYLRKPESLILRVEGRSPSDDEASYHIRFSGSFAPLISGSPGADSATPTDEGNSQPSRVGNRKTTRVSSAGARIEEPVREVAAAPIPEPTPADTPEETAAKTPVARSPRGRRPAPRTTTTKPVAKRAGTTKPVTPDNERTGETSAAKREKSETETTKSSPEEVTPSTNRTEAANNRSPTRRPPPRSSRSTARTRKSEATAENGRLIIEVKDGTRIEYQMSTVTRLTVENGEIVIVTDDGYTKRVPLTSVLRMSIAP